MCFAGFTEIGVGRHAQVGQVRGAGGLHALPVGWTDRSTCFCANFPLLAVDAEARKAVVIGGARAAPGPIGQTRLIDRRAAGVDRVSTSIGDGAQVAIKRINGFSKGICVRIEELNPRATARLGRATIAAVPST